MGLFDGFKKLFRKEIKLDKADKDKIVSLARLKNGKLQFGSVLRVEENYKAVTVYFNNVLDVFEPGVYEIKETTVPKLFMLFFRGIKKEGVPLPDYIRDCELYFVSEKEYDGLKFELKLKTLSSTNNARVKIKLLMEYVVKVSSVQKFMIYLCNTYPIVQNSKVIEEVSFISKKGIAELLSKPKHTFEEFFLSEDKVKKALLDELRLRTSEFGFEVVDINFLDIKVPKKFLALKIAALQRKVDIINGVDAVEKKEKTESPIIKEAPKREEINLAKKDMGVQGEREQTEEQKTNDDVVVPDNIVDIDTLYNDFKKSEGEVKIKEEVVQPSPSVLDIEKRKKKAREEEYAKFNLRREGQSRLSDLVDDYEISDAPQKNPMLFEERKEQKEEKKVDAPKERKLVTCECCGAKNYEGDEFCCVCKSKL